MNCFEIKVTQSFLSKAVFVIDAAKELKKHEEIYNTYIRRLSRSQMGVTGDGTRCKTCENTAKTELLRYIASKY